MKKQAYSFMLSAAALQCCLCCRCLISITLRDLLLWWWRWGAGITLGFFSPSPLSSLLCNSAEEGNGSFTRNTGERRCQLERGCAQGHICMVCHLGLLILAANYTGHRPDDIVHVIIVIIIIYTAFLSPRRQHKTETTQFVDDYIHVLKFLLCVLWTFLVFTSRSYNNWLLKKVGEWWRYTILQYDRYVGRVE